MFSALISIRAGKSLSDGGCLIYINGNYIPSPPHLATTKPSWNSTANNKSGSCVVISFKGWICSELGAACGKPAFSKVFITKRTRRRRTYAPKCIGPTPGTNWHAVCEPFIRKVNPVDIRADVSPCWRIVGGFVKLQRPFPLGCVHLPQPVDAWGGR